MRTGSSVSTEVKPGSNQAKPKTRAANPTRMRGNPGIPRKPKRRSSLSSKLIAAESSATIPHLNPLNAPPGRDPGESGQHVNFDLGEKCERAKSFLSSSVQERMKVRSGNRASGSSRFHAACATCFQV